MSRGILIYNVLFYVVTVCSSNHRFLQLLNEHSYGYSLICCISSLFTSNMCLPAAQATYLTSKILQHWAEVNPSSRDKDAQVSILLEKRNVIMLNMDSVWQALQIQLCGQMPPPKQKRFVCQDKVLCEAMCYTMKSLIR